MYRLAVQRAEIPAIAGHQNVRAGGDGSSEDRNVLLRQAEAAGSADQGRSGFRAEDEPFQQACEFRGALWKLEADVADGFFHRVGRCNERDGATPCQPEQRVGVALQTVGGGEQDIGVEKEARLLLPDDAGESGGGRRIHAVGLVEFANALVAV